MPYITSTQRYHTNRALVEEARDNIAAILSFRFPNSASGLRDAVERVSDLDTLHALRDLALSEPTAEDFERRLDEKSGNGRGK